MFKILFIVVALMAGFHFYMSFKSETLVDEVTQEQVILDDSFAASEEITSPSTAVVVSKAEVEASGNVIENLIHGQLIGTDDKSLDDFSEEEKLNITIGEYQDIDDLSVFENLPAMNIGTPLDVDDLSVYEAMEPMHIGSYKSEDEIYDEFYGAKVNHISDPDVVDVDIDDR